MALDMPEPVAEYLAAEEAKDADALSRCFTEDGTVRDEGQDFYGRDSIRQWKQAADAKYRYALQAVAVQTVVDLVTVRARLTGEFPGSPVELDHVFKLSNNKIVSFGDSIMTMAYPFSVSGDEFKGKRVLVTGGTKGMGQAMVRRFTLSGASVATTARSPMPEGQEVALFVQTDVGTPAGVQEVINRIQQEWRGLDILVNNVGGSDAPNGGYEALSVPIQDQEKRGRLLRAEDVAEITGLSIETLAQWRSQRKGIPFLKLSRNCVRYQQADLEHWLNERIVRVEYQSNARRSS